MNFPPFDSPAFTVAPDGTIANVTPANRREFTEREIQSIVAEDYAEFSPFRLSNDEVWAVVEAASVGHKPNPKATEFLQTLNANPDMVPSLQGTVLFCLERMIP